MILDIYSTFYSILRNWRYTCTCMLTYVNNTMYCACLTCYCVYMCLLYSSYEYFSAHIHVRSYWWFVIVSEEEIEGKRCCSYMQLSIL
jgi:hypothetical protein